MLTDRFLLRIAVSYPTMEEEQAMLRIKEKDENIKVNSVVDTSTIMEMQRAVDGVKISDDILAYITRLVDATRTDIHVVMGGSPRAEIAFMKCGKAKALIEGRGEVVIDDIKYLARAVLSHRIVVRATGGVGVNGVIDGIVASVR